MVIVTLVVCSVLYGDNFRISPADFVRSLTGSADVERLTRFGVTTRLPRALLAVLVGAALAVAGALLQALTRNPLASPDIIGVSQGVVAAVLLLGVVAPNLPYQYVGWIQPVCGTIGGIGTAAVIHVATRRLGSAESSQFILIGILIGGILTSVSSLALIFLGSDASRVFGFMSGSLNLKGWDDLRLAATYLAPGLILLLFAVPRANALQLGDDVALGLGQRLGRDRLLVLAASVLLTAGAVTVVGALSFVGLMAPHMVRRWVGSDLRRLIPASALMGAVIVVVGDFAARNIQPQRYLSGFGEKIGFDYLPTGLYLAVFGVPFMISLIWRRR
ncbi:FecCD family ABC transporter permease [Kribbella sp. GL6]|uniref:FecCD family ABC transporter permease n=1 Tax=Kribbella sp. GL6 TaxID=3419765 RepID=UPI003D047659